MDMEHAGALRRRLDHLERLTVDFDHLERLAEWLDTVAMLTRDDLTTSAALAARGVHIGRYGHAFGDDRIPEAPPLARRTEEIAQAVQRVLAAVAAELEAQASLVHGIVHHHRDTEDRGVALLVALTAPVEPAASGQSTPSGTP